VCLRVRRCGTLSPSKSPLCPAGSPNLKLYENIRGEISARCHQWALKSGAVRSGISLATCEGYNYLDEVIRRRLTRTPRPLPQSLDGRFAHSLARSSRLMAPDDGQILRDLRSHPMTAVDLSTPELLPISVRLGKMGHAYSPGGERRCTDGCTPNGVETAN